MESLLIKMGIDGAELVVSAIKVNPAMDKADKVDNEKIVRRLFAQLEKKKKDEAGSTLVSSSSAISGIIKSADTMLSSYVFKTPTSATKKTRKEAG